MLLERRLDCATVESDPGRFSPIGHSLYVYGVTTEPRTTVAAALATRAPGTRFEEIKLSADGFSLEHTKGSVALRNRAAIQQWLESDAPAHIYLDVTGLPHSAWAPVLRGLLATRIPSSVVYVEPDSYKFSESGAEGEYFDLSERIEGVRPIPSFDSFASSTEHRIFAPLLGFEGARFQHILSHLDLRSESVRPIVGVPGFHLEFPSYTFLGNHAPLARDGHWMRAQFARANCAFAAYEALAQIHHSSAPGARLTIAPIGTKPHAIGAILYVLCATDEAEIVYDHPLRRDKRTAGIGILLEYPLEQLKEPFRARDASS